MRTRRHCHASLIIWAVVALLTGSLARSEPDILPRPPVTPSKTSVLLLPALDATTDSTNMQAPRQLVVRHRLEYEFITRQFKMLGETIAAKEAAATPKIELGDLSQRTSKNLDLLARRTGADWVVTIVVQEAALDSSTEKGFTVHTRVLLQVWDARRHGWLADGPYVGKADGEGTPVLVFKSSLDDAIKGSLAGLLGSHPQVVFVSQEESLCDYLAGQKTPFVGEPKKPFSGLKTEQ